MSHDDSPAGPPAASTTTMPVEITRCVMTSAASVVRSVRVNQCTGRRGSGPLTTYLCLYVAPPIALMIATAVITALDGAIPV